MAIRRPPVRGFKGVPLKSINMQNKHSAGHKAPSPYSCHNGLTGVTSAE